MNVNLTPQLEAMIRRKVETGLYNNASEVVRDALRLMAERDRISRLQTALAIGDEEYRRGEVVELTPAVWAEIEREADEADRLGLPIDPDVCP
jgi:antitoxin ParD1/3/4